MKSKKWNEEKRKKEHWNHFPYALLRLENFKLKFEWQQYSYFSHANCTKHLVGNCWFVWAEQKTKAKNLTLLMESHLMRASANTFCFLTHREFQFTVQLIKIIRSEQSSVCIMLSWQTFTGFFFSRKHVMLWVAVTKLNSIWSLLRICTEYNEQTEKYQSTPPWKWTALSRSIWIFIKMASNWCLFVLIHAWLPTKTFLWIIAGYQSTEFNWNGWKQLKIRILNLPDL